MTIGQFLNSLLEDQQIPENFEREMEKDRERIIKTIFEIRKLLKPTIYYGGSHGKKTLIKESYDLDIVLYYPNETDCSVKEIYELIFNQLNDEYNKEVIKKNVAIRILKREKYHIDVVPGKRIANSENDAYIYKSKQGVSLKTSVKKHIEIVSEFGRRDILKLLKLWKVRNELNIPSFVLEIVAIKAMEKIKDADKTEEILIEIFRFISENLTRIRLEDPANPSNIISDEDVISSKDKQIVADAAAWTINNNNLDTIEGWKNIFKKKVEPPSVTSNLEDNKISRLSPDSPGRRFAK